MPTDHDSIVEALRSVLENSHVEGIHNSDGEWLQAGIVIEVDDARRMREEAIPAVESLVAENARLRKAHERIVAYAEWLAQSDRTEAEKAYHPGADAAAGVSRRALKGDD